MNNGDSKKIVVYGAGGFGREIVWLAQSCKDFDVVAIVDDDPGLHGSLMNNVQVMALGEVKAKFTDAVVVVAVGSPRVRERIIHKVEQQGLRTARLIHPNTEMSQWVEIGQGVVICAGCILTTNICLKDHVQINLDCTIGHDVVMGEYTTLAPGVHVSGWVHFGKRVYVGSGAVFINGTQDAPLVVGDDAVIGAGAVVTRSVPQCETWGGCLQRPFENPLEFEKDNSGKGEDEGEGKNEGEDDENNEGDKGAENENQDKNESDDRFSDWHYPEIKEGRPTKYNWVVQNMVNLKLGYKTDIGAFSYINAKFGVTIEDFVQIGSHCSIYSVSTIDDKQGPVSLGKNCRIGSHSVIMPGVTVGKNAVVGAFSFVNCDVPENAIVAGIPAKALKKH